MSDAASAVKPRDLDTHHLFSPPASKKEWESRARDLRRQVLFSAGLWPMPVKTPLHSLVTGHEDGPDYTIDNVAIETLPGFWLCGNLYRPKGRKGPFPGIANPHGHWENGRLEIQEDVPKADPPPAPPSPGRGNLVSIGVNLARQGFVTFAYDMVGYNDTVQVPDHRTFGGNAKSWLWSVSLAGLQLWNSIRVVDYLESLPYVDKKRIGVTGASGGGTQTFLLCAVDDRIAAAVPVNMVSAYMQGGCLCENGPGLRVGTDNVEIASLLAPKPLLLVCCTGDWTSKVPVEEWPTLRKVYELYSAADKTAAVQFNYQHNYNVESREAMYAWFGKWLLNDSDASHFKEKPFTVDVNAMRVWNQKTPMPADALNEKELGEYLVSRAETQLSSIWPADADSLKLFRNKMAPALASSLAIAPNKGTQSKVGMLIATDAEHETEAEELAAKLRARVLVLDETPESAQTLWDSFYTCYNRTSAGNAVAEITALIGRKTVLVGLGRAGLYALLARAVSGQTGKTILDANGFDAGSDDAYISSLYSPGLRRAGGVESAAVLCAPSPLCLFNTQGKFETERVKETFHGLNTPLEVKSEVLSVTEIIEWVKK